MLYVISISNKQKHIFGPVYSQCHADILKCTEPNVNKHSHTSLTTVYVHFYFVLSYA